MELSRRNLIKYGKKGLCEKHEIIRSHHGGEFIVEPNYSSLYIKFPKKLNLI